MNKILIAMVDQITEFLTWGRKSLKERVGCLKYWRLRTLLGIFWTVATVVISTAVISTAGIVTVKATLAMIVVLGSTELSTGNST